MVVDLPAPFGPSRAKNRLGRLLSRYPLRPETIAHSFFQAGNFERWSHGASSE